MSKIVQPQTAFNQTDMAVPAGYVTMEVEHDLTHEMSVESLADWQTVQQALQESMSALINMTDLRTIMRQILKNLQLIVRYDATTVRTVSQNLLTYELWEGFSAECTDEFIHFTMPFEEHSLYIPIGSGAPYVIDSVAPTSDLPENVCLVSSDMASRLVVPLRAHNQVIGILNLFRHTDDGFTVTDANYAVLFSNQLAIALSNTQLYDSLEDNLRELQSLYHATSFFTSASSLDELCQQIAHAVVWEFHKTDCGVLLVDEKNEAFIRLARAGDFTVDSTASLYPTGPGLVPKAFRDQDVVYVADVGIDTDYEANNQSTRSEMVIPLQGRHGVIGVLDLQSPAAHAFDSKDERILRAFAARAGAAIESMRLFEQVVHLAEKHEKEVFERTAELYRVKDRVETILNSTSDTIMLMRSDGTIQQCNTAFYTLFGYDFGEGFGMKLTEILTTETPDGIEDAINNLVNDQASSQIEVVALRKDGNQFPAEIMLSKTDGNDTRSAGIICSLRDITRRKLIENDLRQALEKERELNDLKSRFVSMVSHEFRTPLATIQASSDVLKDYYDRLDEEKRQARFKKIRTQIKHMTSMLDDVMSIGRFESGKTDFNPTTIDMDSFCQEIVEQHQNLAQATHQIHYTFDCAFRTAHVDEKLMHHSISNLLSNAIKYSPAQSEVNLEISCDGDDMIIRITDQGIGIPPEDVEHLFEAFHRANNVGTTPGTGLGLAIFKYAIDMHNGSVEVESQINTGTTFTVTLPNVKVE